MSGGKELVISSMHLFAGRVATVMLTSGFTIYFAHALSKQQFSALAVFAVLLAITNFTSSLGLETLCLRNVPALVSAGDNDRAASMQKTATASRAVFSFAVVAALYFFADELSVVFFEEQQHGEIIRIICIGLFFGSLNTSLGLTCQAVKSYKAAAYVQFYTAAAYCLLASIGYSEIGYEGWLAGYSLSRSIGTLIYVRVLWKWLSAPVGFYPWTHMVRTAFPFYIRGFMLFGRNNIDQLVVSIISSAEMLATYYVACTFRSYMQMAVEAIRQPMVIRLAELNSRKDARLPLAFSRLSRYGAFLFVPICFGVIAYGYPLLELYGGAKYLDGYPVLVVVSLTTLVGAVFGGVYIQGLFVIGRPLETFFVDAAGSVVNVILLPVLLGMLGIIGAAASVLVSTVIAVLVARRLLTRHLRIDLDWPGVNRSIAVSGLVALIAGVMQIIYYNYWIIPLYLVSSVVLFLFLIARVLSEYDIKYFSAIFSGRMRFLMGVIHRFRHG